MRSENTDVSLSAVITVQLRFHGINLEKMSPATEFYAFSIPYYFHIATNYVLVDQKHAAAL